MMPGGSRTVTGPECITVVEAVRRAVWIDSESVESVNEDDVPMTLNFSCSYKHTTTTTATATVLQ